ncbi:MAG: TolC family protein [Acidobacteria bacterium]|nr:TolC family protein [Acidobacteriota bacterium]
MRILLLGALPCLLMAQAPTLTFDDILQRARTSPEQVRIEALLAERHRALSGTRGFLREGPSVGLAAGPRSNPAAPTTTDRTVEVDLPLFLAPGTQRRLEAALGHADPRLREAARIEAGYRLRQAYLDAWLGERLLQLREADLATVQAWLQAARARLEAGADPAFQVSLVEGELLRTQMEVDEARRQRLQTWAGLRALSEVPGVPVPLADPGVPALPSPEGLQARFEGGPLRKAIQSRLELDQQTLRHQEALAGSRWSLRGSHGREGEDRITKVGLAYRFGRPGEGAALRREVEANLQAGRRELEIAQLELEARFQSALARLQSTGPLPTFTGFETALLAVGLRLAEGRERPSEALPIRRQLLEAQMATLRRIHATHLLKAELEALTPGMNP